LFQVASLYSRSDRYSFALLLEACIYDNDDLNHIAGLLKILLLMYDLRDFPDYVLPPTDWLGELRQKLPDALVHLIDLPQYQDFLRCCWLDNEEPASIFQTLPLMRRNLRRSRAFGIFMDVNSKRVFKDFNLRPRHDYIVRLPTHSATGPLGQKIMNGFLDPPFIAGLRRILSQQLEGYQERLLPAIRGWFPPEHDQELLRSKSISLEESDPLRDVAPVNFAFAPSGSGKTTSVFNKLVVEYGHYMVSSALGSQTPDPKFQCQNIIDPKQLHGVSKDTRELFKMLKYIEALDRASEVGTFLIPLTCTYLWSTTLMARSFVFRAFLEAKGPQATPEMWLSFQINCRSWDPFLQVFRAMAFCLDRELPTRPFFAEKTEIAWICVDEAQEDLRYENGSGDNLLGYALGAFYGDGPESLQFTNSDHVIFLGTSFNISKALETREKQIRKLRSVNRRKRLEGDDRFKVVTNYQQVRNVTDAETVLQDYGLKAKRVLQSAPQYGRMLWGRVQWTAMFAERLLHALTLSQLPNSEEHEISEEQCKSLDLRKVADDTYEGIVEQLIDKLHLIRGRENGEDLLTALLGAAISADICNSPHTFERKDDLELVEHGFATIVNIIDKAKDELRPNFITTFNSMRRCELTAQIREQCAIEYGIIDLLIKSANFGFSVNGWILNELTADMWTRGFTIVDVLTSADMRPGCSQNNHDPRFMEVINKLGQDNPTLPKAFANDFDIPLNSKGQKLVNVKIKNSFKPRIARELTQKLNQNHFLVIDKTIDELNQLVRGFTVRDMDSSPIAELSEPVVIDAVIRFSTVNSLENSLLPRLKNLSPRSNGLSRSDLGGPAEYYLAMVS
jgi:hypothetical protein